MFFVSLFGWFVFPRKQTINFSRGEMNTVGTFISTEAERYTVQ